MLCTAVCMAVLAALPLCGGVRLQVRDGRPIVDGVYINGHGPYRFLVDTGSNVNLIETGLARKIGMESSLRVELTSAAGKNSMEGSDGNEIELDSFKADGQRFVFSKLESIQSSLPEVVIEGAVLLCWPIFVAPDQLIPSAEEQTSISLDESFERNAIQRLLPNPVIDGAALLCCPVSLAPDQVPLPFVLHASSLLDESLDTKSIT